MKNILFFVLIVLLMPFFILASDKVEINTAPLEQLDQIAGIGPELAQRIINARPFSSVDDLVKVKGIGEKTLEKIKSQGLAYVENAAIVIQSPAPSTTYPDKIFINEILPNPEGPDETEEWIEIYNANNFDVDLSYWTIQDAQGTMTNYSVPKNTIILSNGFLVFKRPETKIMLNNEEDGLIFLTPDKKIIDSATYSKAPLGQSFCKTSSGWQWSAAPTPGAGNTISAAIKNNSKALPKTKKTDTNNIVEAGLADISQSIQNQDIKNLNPWFLFFTALSVTAISAIAVLFIKLKIKRP